MPKCIIKNCNKLTRHKITKEKYCSMHKERIKRHGYPELKREKGEHALEKLPHEIVDDYIQKNCKEMGDNEIAKNLKKMGFKVAQKWNVGYRRRKLGERKYLRGEIQKHRAWVRSQAIKKYGKKCELCGYTMAIDTHHIIPRHKGGPHEIDNLMVVCPNCHALITRKYITLGSRVDIPKTKKKVLKTIKRFYSFL